MVRPLRIEYPDAWYHVMNRARRGQDLYTDKDDHLYFIDLLQETAGMFNIRVGGLLSYAYPLSFVGSDTGC